jgi:hypothetical protein
LRSLRHVSFAFDRPRQHRPRDLHRAGQLRSPGTGLARETKDVLVDREMLIRDLLDGRYEDQIRTVAFNTAQGWSRDVAEDIANELRQRCADRGEIPASLQDFLRGETPF